MVFSSIPAYLDPANWQQQPNPQTGASTGVSTQFVQPQAPPPPPPQPHGSGGGGAGSIRPGSMADRARMANVPMPEAALECPRCESTNTKFCYFNNYSLSQPRHFCKTCRRYWTRGGALRNVPVGGGCRRNKRSKGGSSGSSKSPVNSTDRQTASGNNSTSTMSCNNSGGASDILGLGPQIPQLRFMTPNLHHFTSEFPSGDIGLNYGSLTAPPVANELNFGGSLLSSLSGLDQWRLQQQAHHHQQFPFLGGLDSSSSSPSGLYPFEGGVEASGYGVGGSAGQIRPKISSTGIVSQLAAAAAPVKMEESSHHHHHHQQQEINLSRQFLGMQGNEHQYWSSTTAAGAAAAGWTDLSSFSSSSTSNPL